MATALKSSQAKTVATRRSTGLARGVYTLWLKQMHKFFSSSMEVGSTLFVPVLWMLLFGVCMGTTANNLALGYISFITPGVMLLTGLTAAALGGSTLLQENLSGALKEYLVAPVPRLAILLGTLAGSLTKAIGQAVIIWLMSLLLGAALILNPLNILAGLSIVLLYSLGFAGIAVALACRAKRMEAFHSIIMIMNMPMLFLSNALYPLQNMPEIIRFLAYFNPTTYAVDALRYLFYGAQPEIGLLADFGVVLLFVAVSLWFSRRAFQRLLLQVAG